MLPPETVGVIVEEVAELVIVTLWSHAGTCVVWIEVKGIDQVRGEFAIV